MGSKQGLSSQDGVLISESGVLANVGQASGSGPAVRRGTCEKEEHVSRPSACWAGPTCALPWQRFSHASILAGLQFGMCWSTTSQTSVWAQAGDTGTHSRFLPRNLIHRCLLKDAKLPSQTQHFVLLQRKKIVCGCRDRVLQQPDSLRGSRNSHIPIRLAVAGAQSARSM